MTDYFIGTDIGTGSVKSLALDLKGKVIATAQIPYPTIQSKGISEQDADIVFNAFTKTISNIVTELGSAPAGIGLSSAMHSLLFVNSKGEPLSKMITWADNRASEVAMKLKNSPLGKRFYEENGTPIHAMTPLCKLIWFKENNNEALKQAHKIISIKEYVWSKLFRTFEADHSIASATGLMNIQSLKWSTDALDLGGIRESQLSDLVSTSFCREGVEASIAAQMKLTAKTKVVVGASDGCMANLGSFATEPGIGALTIGTSGAIRVASKQPVLNFDAMTFNYRLDESTFISGGPTNNGGVVLKWYAENVLSRNLKSSDDYHELLDPAKNISPGAEGLMFLPYILGERAPIWNSHASGVFFGAKNYHTQHHFTRAVLEGISMALYNIASEMESSGLKIDQVNVSGGFIHSAVWLDILTNMFGKKICLVNSSDASALGAAFMGMKKLNMIDSYDTLKNSTVKELHPDRDKHDRYLNQLEKYKKLYRSLADAMTA